MLKDSELNLLMIPNQPNNRSLQIRFIALAALVVIALLPFGGTGFSSCPSTWLFSTTCPACGLTRSMNALIHLDPNTSFYFHPLGWLILLWLTGVMFTNNASPFEKSRMSILQQVSKILSFKFLVILFLIVWLFRIYYYGKLNFI